MNLFKYFIKTIDNDIFYEVTKKEAYYFKFLNDNLNFSKESKDPKGIYLITKIFCNVSRQNIVKEFYSCIFRKEKNAMISNQKLKHS